LTETGIDYKITFICRQIRYLEAKKCCELCGRYVSEQGSELSRPHLHHYFFEPGIPWDFRHNPAFMVCTCLECHEVNIDAPHKDSHAFRRKYHVILEKYNLPRLYVLRAAEEHLKEYKSGILPITTPTREAKKKLLNQLRLELKRVEEETFYDVEACQVDRMI